MKPATLAPYFVVLLLCASLGVQAEPAQNPGGTQPAPMDHSTMKGMDHSTMKGMDHSTMEGMDHSTMKGMDHSTMKGMDHSTMEGMDHSTMEGMDHSTMESMDHSTMKDMDHSTMEGMDHSTMEGMDHSTMEGMDHSSMEGMDHSMTFDARGMVMNSNADQLPEDCDTISRDYDITVRVGTRYAEAFPGNIFGMSQHLFEVEPCSRINLTFINEDSIRHQFMVHGLPRYLYSQGMFHMEAVGGETLTGSLIVPSDNKTYLVHCDIAQHMEKGMKGQIKVGRGSGDLTSIPGVSALFRPDNYQNMTRQILAIAGGVVLALAGLLLWRRYWR